ncbi:hypothetical protein HaLaN_08384, partial [Haematococcus lacustris]
MWRCDVPLAPTAALQRLGMLLHRVCRALVRSPCIASLVSLVVCVGVAESMPRGDAKGRCQGAMPRGDVVTASCMEGRTVSEEAGLAGG